MAGMIIDAIEKALGAMRERLAWGRTRRSAAGGQGQRPSEVKTG